MNETLVIFSDVLGELIAFVPDDKPAVEGLVNYTHSELAQLIALGDDADKLRHIHGLKKLGLKVVSPYATAKMEAT